MGPGNRVLMGVVLAGVETQGSLKVLGWMFEIRWVREGVAQNPENYISMTIIALLLWHGVFQVGKSRSDWRLAVYRIIWHLASCATDCLNPLYVGQGLLKTPILTSQPTKASVLIVQAAAGFERQGVVGQPAAIVVLFMSIDHRLQTSFLKTG